MCVGAQKGGTQWLYDQLCVHPEFWMPPLKEIRYFHGLPTGAVRRLYERALADLDGLNRQRAEEQHRPIDRGDIAFLRALLWLDERPRDVREYAKLFNPKGDRLSGELTPFDATLPEERIAEIVAAFPSMKVFYIIRDPVERFWSQYCMAARREGRLELPTPERLAAFAREQPVASHSRPSEAVALWTRHVPPENFALSFFDDLEADPAGFRASILGFLGADPARGTGVLPPGFNRKSVNPTIEMTPGVRWLVARMFADELRRCAKRFGGPAEGWLARYAAELAPPVQGGRPAAAPRGGRPAP
ncbi:sulfotransferase, partial [Propylenella binzhouense]